MDAQMENVLPERGRSSLQMLSDRIYIQAPKRPHTNPLTTPKALHQHYHIGTQELWTPQRAKSQKKRKADDHTATSTPAIPSKVFYHLSTLGQNG